MQGEVLRTMKPGRGLLGEGGYAGTGSQSLCDLRSRRLEQENHLPGIGAIEPTVAHNVTAAGRLQTGP